MAEFLKQELIWIRKPEQVFMYAARKILLSKLPLQTWKLQNVNGRHINKKTDVNRKENYLSSF